MTADDWNTALEALRKLVATEGHGCLVVHAGGWLVALPSAVTIPRQEPDKYGGK